MPFVRSKGLLAVTLKSLVGPLRDDVRGRPATIEPQVPAAITVCLVHARDDRAGRIFAGRLQPNATGKGMILLEISHAFHLDRAGGVALEGFSGRYSAVPNRLAADSQGSRLTLDGHR